MKSVDGKQLGKFQEVRQTTGMLEVLVKRLAMTHDFDVVPEDVTESPDFVGCFGEAARVAGHADFVPHDLAEFPVNTVD